MSDDRRLIEDYLFVNSVGKAASREPRAKGHISTLHLWWARRLLVACTTPQEIENRKGYGR